MLMRGIIISSSCFILLLLSCNQNSEFKKIGKQFDGRDSLIYKINPNSEILYWKYIESYPNRTVREVGNKDLFNSYNFEEPEGGFYIECHPAFCFSYIVYINKEGLNYITDEKSLQKFIGTIDNIEEAILIGKTLDLGIDSNDKKGGSYKKTQNGFDMYLLRYNGCPETYESIQFTIDFNGNFKNESKGIYKKTGDCYIS